ncbi:MAG: hypothetical protein FWD61_09900 [Phycisphaerales bacterium]|nr:hypothetical protein [Phycisphaerales bacterium]
MRVRPILGILIRACLASVVMIIIPACAKPAQPTQLTMQEEGTPPATQAATDPKWNDLLSRLGADDFKTRDTAQKELAKQPISERPLLKKLADQATDAEIKARLQARLAEMDEELALNPPPVSLDLKDATLREAFEELSKQTGLTIKGWPDYGENSRLVNQPMNQSITLHVDRQPLWVAVRKIAKQVPLLPLFADEEADLRLNVDVGNSLRMSVLSGPVLIVLNNIDRHDVAPGEMAADAKTQNNFNANFHLAIDPRVRVYYAPRRGGKIQLTEVTDDKGHSLLVTTKDRSDEENVRWLKGGYAYESLPLHAPEPPATRIAVMKGTLVYSAETLSYHADLNLPGAGEAPTVATLDGMIVALKTFSVKNGQAVADLQFQSGEMDKTRGIQDLHATLAPRMQLLDASGAVISDNKHSGSTNGIWLNYQYNFSLNDSRGKAKFTPAKFRVTVTAKTREVTMPFEFHDVPLP